MRGCILLISIILGTSWASQVTAQNFDFFGPDLIGVPGDLVSGPFTLDSTASIQGISFAICHDPLFAVLVDAQVGADLAVANGGGMPAFLAVDLLPNLFTIGCVVDLLGVNEMNPGFGLELVVATYGITPAAMGVSSLDFCVPTNPPVQTTVVIGGMSVMPTTTPGSITVVGENFERGDCNSDASFNIADAIALLGDLFPSGPGAPPIVCDDACDANDDGAINIADAIAILGILFSGTVSPEPINCGPDPTPGDPLNCSMSGAC